MDTRYRSALRCVLAFGLALELLPANAAAVFIVTEPWVRVASNGRSAEAYMQLRSSEGGAVVGVRSELTANIAMRPPGAAGATVNEIPLPAGASVLLAPGAYRLALPSLGRPLKLGDRVALVLIVAAADGSRQEIPVNAEVRRRSPTDDHKVPHHP
jgi:copper(I)-binding protein